MIDKEIRDLFCRKITEKLKARVRGDIRVFCTNDYINIEIQNVYSLFNFRAYDIEKAILFGYSDLIATGCLRRYKNYILNLFIKE